MTAPRFYSEYSEDRWIVENLGRVLPESGFYVDVGAMRPDANSNTAFLRDRGWKGLVIDAHPDCRRHWEGVPNVEYVQAVVAATSYPAGFICREEGREAESRPGAFYEVQQINACLAPGQRPAEYAQVLAMPLGLLLAERLVTRCDFLSIDIEGGEYEALASVPWRGGPRLVVVEYATQCGERVVEDYRSQRLLLANDYTLVHQTVANQIFLRR